MNTYNDITIPLLKIVDASNSAYSTNTGSWDPAVVRNQVTNAVIRRPSPGWTMIHGVLARPYVVPDTVALTPSGTVDCLPYIRHPKFRAGMTCELGRNSSTMVLFVPDDTNDTSMPSPWLTAGGT